MTASPSPQRANEIKQPITARHDKSVDINALLAENDKLRGLVVQLSELVIRNAVDHR
jgi:hypothetical protein